MKFFVFVFVFVSLALTVTGCNVGPNYAPPVVTVRETTMADAAPTTAPTNGPATIPTTQHSEVSINAEPVAQWWTTLNDPQLNRLIDRAIAGNLDLQIAASRIRESRHELKLVGADLLPKIDATGNYARIDTGKNQAIQTNGGNTSTGATAQNTAPISGIDTDLFAAGLDATWELDVFGGQRRNIEAYAADFAASVEDRRDRYVSLTAEVAHDYLALRGLQRRVQIAQDNLKLQQDTLDVTRSLRKAGFNSELDVSRANTQVAQTQAGIVPLQTQVVQVEHALGTLIGQEPRSLIDELSPTAAVPVVPPVVEIGVPTDLLRRRADIRRAEHQIAAANARIGVAVAGYYPRFSLTGDFGFDSSKFKGLFDWESHYLLVNPSVSWNLFDFGRTAERIRMQKEERTQADLTYRQTILRALQECEDAVVAYRDEQTHHDALANAVTSARDSVRISRDQYKQGLIDFLQVLDAQRQLLISEDSLAQSDMQIATNLVGLYKALGGGWEKAQTTPAVAVNDSK